MSLPIAPRTLRCPASPALSGSASASGSSASTASPSDSIASAPCPPLMSLLLGPNQLAGAEVAAIEADMLFRPHVPSDPASDEEQGGRLSPTEDQDEDRPDDQPPAAADPTSSPRQRRVTGDTSVDRSAHTLFPPARSPPRSPPNSHIFPSAHSPTCPVAHPPLPSPTHLALPRPVSGFYSESGTAAQHANAEHDPLLRHSQCTPRYGTHHRATSGTQPRSSSIWSAPELCCGAAVRAARARRQRLKVVYSAIFCVCFFTSLEANTAYLYYNWGLSDFGALASFSTVSIAQQMMYAVAKPPIAVVSDIFGRAEALALALALYSVGFSIVATAGSFRSFLLGVIIQSAGTTGIQVLQSIIVADTTSPQYRGLVLGAINLPYLINFMLAGPLAELVVRYASWRVGIAAYAVLVPLAALPLLITLSMGRRKVRAAGVFQDDLVSGSVCPPSPLSPTTPTMPPTLSSALLSPAGSDVDTTVSYPPRPVTLRNKFRRLGSSLDFLGLCLFAIGWLLVLLPLTLRDKFTTRDTMQYALAGAAVLAVCLYWQTRTPTPIVPIHVLRRQTIYVCLLGLVDFASFSLTFTYLSAFVQVVKGWNQTRTAYFSTTQNITSTLVGLMVGWAMSATKKFRTLMICGVVVRIIGVSLMVRFRNSKDQTPLLVLCQLLQGMGGGGVAITMQVAAQVCAGPRDIATVTAFQLLVTEVGAALGSAVAGLIVSDRLPRHLAALLPQLDPQKLRAIYGSLPTALSYPLGSPERNGIIEAWVRVMYLTCIVATAVLIPALALSWAMPNATLRNQRRRHAPRLRRARSRSRMRRRTESHAQPGSAQTDRDIASAPQHHPTAAADSHKC